MKTFLQRLLDAVGDLSKLPKMPPLKRCPPMQTIVDPNFERIQVEYDSAMNMTFIWKREQQGTAVHGGCIARIKGKYDFDFIVIGEENPA